MTLLKKDIPIILAIFLLLPSLFAAAPKHMLGDLDIIEQVFEMHYAPKEWKQEHVGWNLREEAERMRTTLTAQDTVSIKEFQQLLSKFLRTTHDYHVNAVYHAQSMSLLPFRIMHAEGRFFISHIDRSLYSSSLFPYNIGDEVLSFGGQPISNAIQRLREEEIGFSNEETDLGYCCHLLTQRMGALGYRVPSGTVLVEFKKKDSANSKREMLCWMHLAETINDPHNKIGVKKAVKAGAQYSVKTRYQLLPLLQKSMLAPQYATYLQPHCTLDIEGLEGNDQLGAKKSYIPQLGELTKENRHLSQKSPYHTYIFSHKKRKIGYIRLHTYQDDDCDLWFEELKKIIRVMQAHTDALVIDQINNPGGYLFNCMAILTLLSPHPLHMPKHRIAISQKQVDEAITLSTVLGFVENDEEAKEFLGDTFTGYPISYSFTQDLKKHCEDLIREWGEGKTLTSPLHWAGLETLTPDPEACYTKPILVIINGLSMSGGDFLPAILQDNKRAMLFGTRTAGAGGCCDKFTYPNRSGISEVYYTSTLAERIDGSILEDFGVEPDVIYKVTTEDLQYAFKKYKEAILETLDKVLAH